MHGCVATCARLLARLKPAPPTFCLSSPFAFSSRPNTSSLKARRLQQAASRFPFDDGADLCSWPGKPMPNGAPACVLFMNIVFAACTHFSNSRGRRRLERTEKRARKLASQGGRNSTLGRLQFNAATCLPSRFAILIVFALKSFASFFHGNSRAVSLGQGPGSLASKSLSALFAQFSLLCARRLVCWISPTRPEESLVSSIWSRAKRDVHDQCQVAMEKLCAEWAALQGFHYCFAGATLSLWLACNLFADTWDSSPAGIRFASDRFQLARRIGKWSRRRTTRFSVGYGRKKRARKSRS